MSSFWTMLTGGGRQQRQQQRDSQAQSQSPQSSSSSSSSSGSLSLDSTPATQYRYDYAAPHGVETILQGPAFANPSQLHPLAGLNKDSLEYLTLEESALSDLPGQSVIPSRGFFDDMCYGAGIAYLSGLGIGGAWGLREGLIRSAAQPPRLRLNAVLNSVTRRGPFLGNSAGVVAILYNVVNFAVSRIRGKHDAANTVLAGALSGMAFKSTRGPQQMLISGAVVATVAGAWAILRRTLLPQSEKQPQGSNIIDTVEQ